MNEAQLRRHPGPWTPQQWILRTMILEPNRICDPAEKEAWFREHYSAKARAGETPDQAADRVESRQIRAGTAQGILAPAAISPLASERRKAGSR